MELKAPSDGERTGEGVLSPVWGSGNFYYMQICTIWCFWHRLSRPTVSG